MTRTRSHGRCAGTAVVLLVLTAILTACGTGGTDGEEETGMMRERTIDAFEGSNPELAEFAGADGTRPEPIDAPFLEDWYVFQLTGGHRAVVVAVTKEGDPRGLKLTGAPEAWEEVVEGVTVSGKATATEVADAWVKAFRPTSGGAYFIDSVDDIKWSGPENEAAHKAEREIRRDFGDEIGDQATRAVDGGWTTTRWMVDDNDLVRLELTIRRDGTVDAERTVERKSLPGPIPL